MINNINGNNEKIDNSNFLGIDNEILKFINSIDFDNITENLYHPNYGIQLIKKIEHKINYNISEENLNKINYINTIDFAQIIIGGFFSNIFLTANSFISVCNGHKRIISNNSFKDYTGRNNNDIDLNYKDGTEKEKVSKYVNNILSGKYSSYNHYFELEGNNIAWTTTIVPNSNINIRFGFIPIEGKKDFEYFYKIGNKLKIAFNKNDFYFIKMIKQHEEKFIKLKNGIESNEAIELYNLLKIKAIILDYMLKFNPNPISFYKGDEPLVFSESFFKITGYNKEELFEYYKKKGEITSLLYKGKNYHKVIEKTGKNNFISNNNFGYDNINFTLTRKDNKEITIPWNNYVYELKSKNILSCRMGNISELTINKNNF